MIAISKGKTEHKYTVSQRDRNPDAEPEEPTQIKEFDIVMAGDRFIKVVSKPTPIPYNRSDWLVLGLISDEIERLEAGSS